MSALPRWRDPAELLADLEVDALIRIVQILHERNVRPTKVTTQRILLHSQNREVVHIEVEFSSSDVTTDALRFIAAKIAQRSVLEHLRTHNLIPNTIRAHRVGQRFIEMKIEVDSVSHDTFRCLLAKIDELPMVVATTPFDVDWSTQPARRPHRLITNLRKPA